MIGLMSAPPHASLPDLLKIISESQEFDSIKLRRGEKKVLNAINKSWKEGKIAYCVPNPANKEKHKERITDGPEKIFILVSLSHRILVFSFILLSQNSCIILLHGSQGTLQGMTCRQLDRR